MAYLVQLGTYAPLNDSWQLALDLNDGQTLELEETGGLDLPPPMLDLFTAGNARLAGERVTRGRYGARTITLRLIAGPCATEAALASVVRQLLALQAQALGPNSANVAGVGASPRVALLVQPPGVTAPVYADVLAMAHALSEVGNTAAWVRLVQEGVELELLCAPFLRGARVTLDNLVANPGMDQPGQQVLWADTATIANSVNSYAVVAGSAMTQGGVFAILNAGSDVTFGASTWQSITQWAVAFIYQSAGTFTFWLHRTTANTGIQVILNGPGNTLSIVANVAGVTTTLTSATTSLTNGTHYWLLSSALPAVNNTGLATLVSTQAYTYSSGAIGASIGSALFGLATAANLQQGQCGLTAAGANLQITTGGVTTPAANQVTLLAADGWTSATTNGDSTASPAWCGWDATNIFAGGPWASQRSLSITAPPAGKLNAAWTSNKMPVTAGATISGRVWVAQTGLSATATAQVIALQYNQGGTQIATLTLATATVAQIGAIWYALTGSGTLNVACAQIALQLVVTDSVVGASAHASVWFGQAQINAGTTVQPYCANRFTKAPAQAQFSGLAGDVAAPCLLALGTSPAGSGLAASASLALYAGRRALAGFGAQLTAPALLTSADGVNQQIIPDATAWSGAQAQFHTASGNYEPLYMTGNAADYSGVYHLLARLRMHDTPASSQNLQPDAFLLQNPWLGLPAKTDRLGIFQGQFVFPFTGATWQMVDSGQVALPPFALGTLTDPTQVAVTLGQQSTTANNQLDADWGALLPVDAELLAATFQNNSTGVLLTGWIWTYFDGLGAPGANMASATWSLEATAVPNPTHAGGGPGIVNQATPALIATGDSVPQVDPTTSTTTATGVNQWLVLVTDNSANVLPIAVVLTYAPLYLEPR